MASVMEKEVKKYLYEKATYENTLTSFAYTIV